MLQIDGAFGEGGGQIIRSSLALSLVTGRAFVVEKIRAGRKKPGLRRQHLTSVGAAAEVGGAEIEGNTIGSRRLVFRPGEVSSGNYHFAIGTAGSTSLVLQTVLPALLLAEGESTVALEGGTHNAFAPPFDFLKKAFLPLLARMGPEVAVTLHRPGFYPAGGGSMSAKIRPAPLGCFELTERGRIVDRRVRAVVANLPRHVAERECRTIAKKTDWPESCFTVEEVNEAHGPGNVVMIEIESEHLTEVFTAFGKKGVKAEYVAKDAVRDARRYTKAKVPVGGHLADQLMLPMAIGASRGTGGGVFRTHEPSMHAKTHLELIRQFLDIPASFRRDGKSDWLVEIGQG